MSTSKQKIKVDRFRSVDETNMIIYTTRPEDFNTEECKELRRSGWRIELVTG